MYKKIAKGLSLLAAAVIAAGVFPTLATAAPANNVDWGVSRSKTATNLDSDFVSHVTLSLPSAEQNLKTDIVFVFDESSCSAPVKAEINNMLAQLYEHQQKTGASIQIGAVQFRGETTEFPLTALNENTKADLSDFMSKRPKVGGSNMSMGLLAGEAMLDADTTVDASRKYMILVSDGITYIWDDPATPEQENFGVNFSNADTPDKPMLAGPDGWDVWYGQKYVPASWTDHLQHVGELLDTTVSTKASPYKRGADISGNPFVKPSETQDYASTVDIALYQSYVVYQRVASKHHAFAVDMGVENEMAVYPYGPSFMKFLADGKEVTFDNILNEVLYLVDAGSRVEDYMGYVEGDYDFNFVNDAAALSLTVGTETFDAVKIADNTYGFKPMDNGKYAYVVTYVPADGANEHFVWDINEAITNFACVQLHYDVKLMNPKTAEGVYGEYDANGSLGKAGLCTNNSATLYPVATNGVAGEPQQFAQPTVSYTVEKPATPDTPDTPDKPEKPETPDTPGGSSKPGKKPSGSKLPETADNNFVALAAACGMTVAAAGAFVAAKKLQK